MIVTAIIIYVVLGLLFIGGMAAAAARPVPPVEEDAGELIPLPVSVEAHEAHTVQIKRAA